MAYNTGNPLGSTDARDLYDNAQNLDKAVNQITARWTDRLGVSRPSWAGMSHYNNVGEYAADILITGYNEVFRYDGEFYRAAAATALPYTTTGSWSEDGPLFVSVGDAVLRHDIAYEADMHIGYYRNAINCNQYGGLNAAFANSDTLGKTIIVTDAQTMTDDIDTTGRSLVVEYSGLIDTTGHVLTINGPFDAGPYQIFTGTGSIVFNADITNPHGWFATGQVVTFNGKLFAEPKLISTGMILGVSAQVDGIYPDWVGGVGDDNTDSTAAFALAVVLANKTRPILLSGIYKVTSSTDNFALAINSSIIGRSPQLDGIHNVGTGSAVLIAAANYYTRWENFSIIGNTSSQDGLVTNITGTSNETSYCTFKGIDIYGNGRHGLVNRNSWGNKYEDCKFYSNGGLGVYLYTPGTPSTDTGTANGISFVNCEARHNGGTSVDTTFSDDKGGVKITGAAGVRWVGGIVESNNAWGFIVSPLSGGQGAGGVYISPAYMEANPSYATVGGNIYTSGPWANVVVNDVAMYYGGIAVGQTGYNFYITGGATAGGTEFYEYNNTSSASGAGTAVLFHPSSRSNLPATSRVSPIFGDYLASGSAADTTLLSITADGEWILSGYIHFRRNTDNTGTILPFTVAYDSVVTDRKIVVGASIAGTSSAAPTLLFSGDNLILQTPAYCYAFVEISEAVASPPTTLAYNPELFGTFMRRK